MGYIKHNAIIVTDAGYPEAKKKLDLTHKKAEELFGDLVSPMIKSKINENHSFFIAPDGSKEYWDLSDEHDSKRKVLANFINSLAYDDGSNAIKFVDVSYDECHEVKIERTNPKKGEKL